MSNVPASWLILGSVMSVPCRLRFPIPICLTAYTLPPKTHEHFHLVKIGNYLETGCMAHGWAKLSRGPSGFAKLLTQIGAPFPETTAWVSTFVELLGGLAIFVG